MENDALDGLLGQQLAFSLALTAVMSHLPAPVAARVATDLQASIDVAREADEHEETAPDMAARRDAIVEAYLKLLRAVV